MTSRRLMKAASAVHEREAMPVTASESRARPMPRTLPAPLHPRPRHREFAEQRRHVTGPQLQDGDGFNPVVRLQDVVARILKKMTYDGASGEDRTPERVVVDRHVDDRNRARRFLRSFECRLLATCDDHIDLAAEQLRHSLRIAFETPFQIQELDRQISAFNISDFAQTILKGQKLWGRAQVDGRDDADHLPPPYSITSSARATRAGGSSIPIALAVLTLTTRYHRTQIDARVPAEQTLVHLVQSVFGRVPPPTEPGALPPASGEDRAEDILAAPERLLADGHKEGGNPDPPERLIACAAHAQPGQLLLSLLPDNLTREAFELRANRHVCQNRVALGARGIDIDVHRAVLLEL